MAFDVEGYRKAAKDAGFSDEEIQKDIDEETQGVAAKGADANMANVKVGTDFMGIPEWLQPAAALTTAAVGLGLGLKGAQKLKDRMSTPEVAAAPRVEPTFGIPDVDGNPPPPPPPGGPTQGKFTPPQGDVTDVASRPVGEARLQIGGPKALPAPEVAVPAAAAPAPAPVAPTAPAAPIAPPAAAEAAAVAPKPVDPLVQARIDALAADQRRKDEAHAAEQRRRDEAHANKLAKDAQRAETKNQTKQGTPTENIETTMQKQSYENTVSKAVDADMKAVAAKKAPPAASVVPPAVTPTAVTPAAVAPTAATPPVKQPVVKTEGAVPPLTKEQKGMKNYLVSQYGGGPEGEAAYKKVIDILGEVPAYEKGQGGGLTKEANQAIKDWRKTNIEGPKVNLTHDMKKAMKGAGGIAILAAIPGFAEAAQRKDYGAMSDIASDFFVLPFAQSREAGMSRPQEESIIASKFKEASKLGSPYRSVPPPK